LSLQRRQGSYPRPVVPERRLNSLSV
jgi:hypothetical protein